jgi:hypothetical protein
MRTVTEIHPFVGDTWRSRDRRDDGLTVTVSAPRTATRSAQPSPGCTSRRATGYATSNFSIPTNGYSSRLIRELGWDP